MATTRPCGVRRRFTRRNRGQVVLAGIMLINSRVDGFMLVMLLPVATRIVSRQLERNYGRLAASLPLEQCWQAGDTPPCPLRDRSRLLETRSRCFDGSEAIVEG